MANVWSAVDCQEEHGSIDEGFDVEGGGNRASVTLRCAWADRYSLVSDIIGNRRAFPNDNFQPLLAVNAGIRPVLSQATVTDNKLIYEQALVTVQYSLEEASKDLDPGSGQLFSDSLEPVTEFITLDYARFRWGSAGGDPLLENEAPGRIQRSFNYVKTIYGLTSIDAQLLNLPGSVNVGAITSTALGLSFGAETLLFGDPSIQRTVDINGTKTLTLTLKFSFKKDGWNKYWRAKTKSFEKIYDVDTGEYKNYPPVSFAPFVP